MSPRHLPTIALVLSGLALPSIRPALPPAQGTDAAGAIAATNDVVSGPYALLAWNDLGMHCMNKDHVNFSVLPPYNDMFAQLIQRGDALHMPSIVTDGVTIEYSIPGNTYSVGKTDFWTYAPALFGVTLPPNVGLTGKGLTGVLDPAVDHFAAIGIPLTPFPDATPAIENAYQQALLIARDGGGAEIARGAPVIPVSVELGCVSSGCHSSETAILNQHENVTGFDPNATPILCAGCHADPVLGTTGRPDAGYFSLRMHGAHKFMDEQGMGTAVCYKCHPGPNTQCLRGVMADQHGLVCQDCHGTMSVMEASIDNGRTPWLQEPACRTCHTSRYGEPVGQLYRMSTGHGGVFCEGCHNSTHGEWPSRVAADNALAIALQGRSGVLEDCRVCHGVYPAGEGPHGLVATSVADEILRGARDMSVRPNPTRGGCDVTFAPAPGERGNMLVFDSQGRTVRLLQANPDGRGGMSARWDGCDARGGRVRPGVYFVRWQAGSSRHASRVTVIR